MISIFIIFCRSVLLKGMLRKLQPWCVAAVGVDAQRGEQCDMLRNALLLLAFGGLVVEYRAFFGIILIRYRRRFMKGLGWYAAAAALAALPLSVMSGSAMAEVAQGPAVVSYDWGSADTLEALGLEEHLVGLPYQSAPGYAAHLLEGRADAGGLKELDAEAVAAVEPDLILVTGRQGEAGQALAEIAEVVDVSLGEGEFFDALSHKVRQLAERFDAVAQADTALDELATHLEATRESLPEGAAVMVVTHNDGNYSLRQEPVVSELLQIEAPAVPDDVESVQRGARTFTPMTPAVMARMSPTAVLVVDRSAAIGQAPLNAEDLEQALAEAGGEDIRVVTLTADLWYLSGAGLNSVRAQVDEVASALAAITTE